MSGRALLDSPDSHGDPSALLVAFRNSIRAGAKAEAAANGGAAGADRREAAKNS
jgi:hypothetical protein